MNIFDPVGCSLNGFQIIEASAGCGKTYTITSIVLRLLVERRLDLESILLVTFTDAAAAELKNRIRVRIRETLDTLEDANQTEDPVVRHLIAHFSPTIKTCLQSALLRLDTASISTIHGFCRRVLSEQAFDSGVSFDATLTTDQAALFEEVARDFFANETELASSLFLEYLDGKGISPKSFIEIMPMVQRAANITVLPPNEKIADPSERYTEAFRHAKNIFIASQNEIETCILSCPGINRRSYRKDLVPKWFSATGAFLLSERPGVFIPEAAARFTTEKLSEGTIAGNLPPQHSFFQAMDALFDAKTGFDVALTQLYRRFIDVARQTAARLKNEREIQTFDDLLQSLHGALQRPSAEKLIEALREKFKAVLIDEFQDTDNIQFEIFSKLFRFENRPFFAIGDPKQSIYAFRGGDIYTYLEAVRAAGDNRSTLNVNYRSDPAVLHAVGTLFERIDNPFFFEEISFSKVSARPDAVDVFLPNSNRGALEIRFLTRERAHCALDKPMPKESVSNLYYASLAADILVELKSKDDTGKAVTPDRLAVLTRTNAQAVQMRDALVAVNVPAVLLKDKSVFDTAEAMDLLCLLRAVNEPFRPQTVRSALSAKIFDLSADKIDLINTDPALSALWSSRFENFRVLLVDGGLYGMFQSVLALKIENRTLGARLLSKRYGERAITNFRHLIELAAAEMSRSGCTVLGLAQWMEGRMADALAGEATPEEAELRLERDLSGVRVLTMHKAKGLEFDIVYIPFLHEGGERSDDFPVFHDPSHANALTVDLSTPAKAEHLRQAAFEQAAEAMRLAYVALTRAKQRCVVSLGAFKSLPSSPAGRLFLSGIKTTPAELSDEAVCGALREIAAASDGTIRYSLIEDVSFQPIVVDNAVLKAGALQARDFPMHMVKPLITTSFTALTNNRVSVQVDTEMVPGDDDKDIPFRDEPTEIEENAIPGEPAPEGLLTFERGTRAGSCLHLVFEKLDFENPEESVVAEALTTFGYDVSWTAPLFNNFCTVLKATLERHEDGFSLSKISTYARLNELAFLLPTSSNDGFGNALAGLFYRFSKVYPPRYLTLLSEIGRDVIEGYLKGFIDLVFEYRGRYYIVDYKSNYLGDTCEAYDRESMKRAMAEHHYYLQYHLYTVALHRFLQIRLPDYDYERCFGGVYYLFVRGMTSVAKKKFGVFFDRPTIDMVEGINALLKGKRVLPNDVLDEMRMSLNKDAQPITACEDTGQLALPGFASMPMTKKPKRKKS